MKEAERKRKILYHQHLTSRCDAQTAARDVLALQAQFLRHAQMSLRLRTRDDSWKQWVKQSVKTRAFRGTLHLLDAEDRLLITSALWKDYEHRKYYMARYYTPQEEQLFCNAILDLLQQGICGRRKIYTRLVAMGLDEKLCKHENPFLPQRHLRRVFNLQGIVYPCFLYKGNVAGRWKLEKETLQLQPFEDFDALQRQQIEKAAKRLLQPARIIWADF